MVKGSSCEIEKIRKVHTVWLKTLVSYIVYGKWYGKYVGQIVPVREYLLDSRCQHKGNGCLLSIDSCDFKNEDPNPYEKEWSKVWYSHQFKGAGLRYEIILCILTGDICWIDGLFLHGEKNDWSIFKYDLCHYLDANERVEVDDGQLEIQNLLELHLKFTIQMCSKLS